MYVQPQLLRFREVNAVLGSVGGALGYVELKVDGELLYRNQTENYIT